MGILYLSPSPNSRRGSFLVVGGGPFYNFPFEVPVYTSLNPADPGL